MAPGGPELLEAIVMTSGTSSDLGRSVSVSDKKSERSEKGSSSEDGLAGDASAAD